MVGTLATGKVINGQTVTERKIRKIRNVHVMVARVELR
jgi:hypothetical protein